MHRILIILYILFFGFALNPFCYAQESKPPATAQPAQVNIKENQNEFKIIENWINLSSQFNDRLIATVYWALSGLVGVLVVIIGYAWFNNHRTYEKDKEIIASQLKNEIGNELLRLRESMKIQQEDSLKKLDKLTKDLVDSGFADIRKEILQIKGSLDSAEQRMKNLYSSAKADICQVEAYLWEVKEIPANALGCWTRLAELSLQQDRHWTLETCLDRIEKLLKEGSRGSYDHDVAALIQKLPQKYKHSAQRINNILISIK